MQKELLTKTNYAAVGEEISHELGAKMVKDFQDTYPEENQFYNMGRNIIELILAQPGCAGMRFYNAINEEGQKTMVYVGIDAKGNNILEYTVVKGEGKLIKIAHQDGIVADRLAGGGAPNGGVWSWT